MQSLQADLLTIQAPYQKALCDVISVAIPLSIVIDTKTGEITHKYDNATQKIIDDLNYCLNKVTESFYQINGLVQS